MLIHFLRYFNGSVGNKFKYSELEYEGICAVLA